MYLEICMVFICTISISLACGSGGWTEGKDGATQIIYVNSTIIKSGLTGEQPLGPAWLYNRSVGGPNPDYWVPPAGYTVDEIREFLKKERQRIKDYEDQMSSSEKRRPKDADGDDDWPDEWTELGYAYKGNAPPTQAIIKNAGGKAELCFLPPVIGNCQRFVFRYGYNPFKATCERFVYSGCGANANNFISRKRCEQVCVGLIKSTCVGSGSTPSYDHLSWFGLPTIPAA